MNIERLPNERLAEEDNLLLEKIPVEEIYNGVNSILAQHGLQAQLIQFTLLDKKFTTCRCPEPSFICQPQEFGRAMARVEHTCYEQCVKFGCISGGGGGHH